jgi:hypothetical protein
LGVDVAVEVGQLVALHGPLAPAQFGEGALEILGLHGPLALGVHLDEGVHLIRGRKRVKYRVK